MSQSISNKNSASALSTYDGMNQRAIHLMQASHYNEASQLLRQTLQEVRSTLAVSAAAADEMEQDSSPSSYFVEQVEVMTVQECEQHQLDDFSLFSKAFLFHSATATAPSKTDDNEEMVVAILFFHLGLALHLEAASTDIPQPKKIQSILRMYDMALQVVQQACQKKESHSNHDFLLILTLAIMNNKAHICALFFELKALTKCIQSMECLLAQFETDQQQNCGGKEAHAAASESDAFELCSQIKLNVMMFSKDIARSAPAA